MSFEMASLVGTFFLAAFCSGVAGFSFNLVAAGILFHVIAPQQMAALLVFASLLIQCVTIGTVWRSIRWPTLLPYLVAGVIGAPFGVWVLRVADGAVIKFGVGILLTGYGGYMLSRLALRSPPPSRLGRPCSAPNCGPTTRRWARSRGCAARCTPPLPMRGSTSS